MTAIAGYTYGTTQAARSPISAADFELLKQSVLFSDEDVSALRMAGEVLADQIDAVLDVWYGFVGAHPHLAYYFSSPQGQLLPDYLARVRARFGQWIMDTCKRAYDQDWLNYQHEIGLRHHTTKKNQTDNAPSVPLIAVRYIIAFIVPITATIRPFLAKKGHSPEQVEKMHQAWFKSVTLQALLWSYPFIREGEF
jgi:hypothetical protein